MLREYALHYKRFGETVVEEFDSSDQALSRSSEILHRRYGVPESLRFRGALLFDQEALFSDWLANIQG